MKSCSRPTWLCTRPKPLAANTMRFFAPALQTAVNARAAMEIDLRQALKTDQFVLYFQPQVDSTGLIGAEALVRWKHPACGLLAPGKFIPSGRGNWFDLEFGELGP